MVAVTLKPIFIVGMYQQLRKQRFKLVNSISPILRIGDQVLTFDVFRPKDLQEVRSTVYIHVQSI